MHRKSIFLLLAILLVIAACGEDDGAESSESEPEPDTPQEFIGAIDAALTSGDQVVHTTVAISGQELGQASAHYSTDELWIYGIEDRARNHFQVDEDNGETPQTTFVIVEDRLYGRATNGQVSVHDGLPARTCPLVDSTLVVHHAVGLFCARFTPQEGEVNEIEAHVEHGVEFQGEAAIVLVYEARNELPEGATPEPERAPDLTVSRLYIGADTRMPLGWTVEMQDESEGWSVQMTADYTNELVARDELPADFFNPEWLDEAEETP